MTNNLLKNYIPNINIYNKLWDKVYKPVEVKASLPRISNQEDSIKYSLKLKEYFEKLCASENIEGIQQEFVKGTNNYVPWSKYTKLHYGIAQVLSFISKKETVGLPTEEELDIADVSIKSNDLFFDFDTVDDLFLDDNAEISVINY